MLKNHKTMPYIFLLASLVLVFCNFLKCSPCNPVQQEENLLLKLDSPITERITFKSEGVPMVGKLYLPKGYAKNKKYPAVIVVGAWTTVKEQMAGLYAKLYSQHGFLALAFDFRNFGESGGKARFHESPKMKAADIRNTRLYLRSRRDILPDSIYAFGLGEGAVYVLLAASIDKGLARVAVAAAHIHNPKSLRSLYGSQEAVTEKIKTAMQAKEAYQKDGTLLYTPLVSKEDSSAAMHGNYHYYTDPLRGGIPAWHSQKFALMSWQEWLQLRPIQTAHQLETPVLMIHSDGAAYPENAREYYESISHLGKQLHWIATKKEYPEAQFDFYEDTEETRLSVKIASSWFKELKTKTPSP